jgi:RNA polymerase sigma-70 factor (ECF subfamily)
MSEAEAAFLRLVRPCWRRLHLVARHYAASADDARDLVQETLLRAWAAYSPSEERAYREGWLFVIQRNVAAEWARQARRRIRLVPIDHDELTEMVGTELSEPFETLPSTTEDQFRELLDQKVVEAFDSLDPSHREVVLLSVAAELSYREIAEVLACPLGTVMSRMGRARRDLREKLAGALKAKGWKSNPSREPQTGDTR